MANCWGRYASEWLAQRALDRQDGDPRWRIAYDPSDRYPEFPWVLLRDPWVGPPLLAPDEDDDPW